MARRKNVRNPLTGRYVGGGRRSWRPSAETATRSSEVESLMRRTVAAVEDVFGPDHPRMATALENLAASLRRMGQSDEAALADARALEIRNAALIRSPRARLRRNVRLARPARSEIVPAVLDVAGAAQYLAISADTMYGLVRSGEVPHVRVGNSIRFRPVDLDRFLDERTSRHWERLDRRGRPRK